MIGVASSAQRATSIDGAVGVSAIAEGRVGLHVGLMRGMLSARLLVRGVDLSAPSVEVFAMALDSVATCSWFRSRYT
jgi:hypothetical protein